MEKQRIDELIARYNAGLATSADQKQLEHLLEQGIIQVHQLQELTALEDQLVKLNEPVSSKNLDEQFYSMLKMEKQAMITTSAWRNFFAWPQLLPKIAIASVTLIIGLAAGYFMRSPATVKGDQQIADLSQQVSDLQEMMMLSLLEKESVTERLKAVSLTDQMDQASHKVTSALLETLNNDENVNVRLAALEALRPYIKDSQVREALVRSIAAQESPLVQVALAEVMAQSQVKSSVKELKKILQNEKTPSDVKKRVQETIEVLT